MKIKIKDEITINKIYIYEAEVIKKRVQLQDNVVNYVKLTRPEGLEEHWPDAGDIINLYFPGNVIYMKHKVIGKRKDDTYIIDLAPVELKYNVKIENLKDEGLEHLSTLPQYINDEYKELPKLSNKDIGTNKNLSLYFDFSNDFIYDEFCYEYIKLQCIININKYIKDTDVYVDTDRMPEMTVYKNEPCIEEIIDKNYNTYSKKFRGIIEKEIKIYRIFIITNICKKVE